MIIYRVLFLKVRTLNTFLDFDVCVYFFSDRICTLLKQIWFFFNSGNIFLYQILLLLYLFWYLVDRYKFSLCYIRLPVFNLSHLTIFSSILFFWNVINFLKLVIITELLFYIVNLAVTASNAFLPVSFFLPLNYNCFHLFFFLSHPRFFHDVCVLILLKVQSKCYWNLLLFPTENHFQKHIFPLPITWCWQFLQASLFFPFFLFNWSQFYSDLAFPPKYRAVDSFSISLR